MTWICSRCSNDEKVERLELPDGRLRPFCRKCRPNGAKPPMMVAESAGRPESHVTRAVMDYLGNTRNTPGGKVMNEPAPPAFKVGQWVRVLWEKSLNVGKLARVEHFGKFGLTTRLDCVMPDDARMWFDSAMIEPALPRAGEWWEKKPCKKDPTSAHSSGIWRYDFPFDNAHEYPQEGSCGCLAPVNYGRGIE